jgi:cullin-associated NEDD8-dissociated protein 1
MSDTVSIAGLLKKTEHYDKDERYMATSDLCEVLKRESDPSSNSTPLDASTERQICTAVLRLLHDKSNDVQAIAVKTLGVLLTTVKQEQVLEIADSLTDQVLDASKSELRDVYAIGLRTLVKTIPAGMGNRVSQRLVGRLLDGIRTSDNDEIVLACLDILTDLLIRFGSSALSVTRQHEPILQMCLAQLSCESPVVRKRAGNAIGCLSVVLSDALLMRMVEALLSQIDMAAGVGKEGRRKTRSMQKVKAATVPTAAGDTRALIRTMCTVSGAVGHRLGQAQIDRILPIFLRFTDPEDAVTGDDDQDNEMDDNNEDEDEMEDTEDEAAVALANELRESCFMGFESFVLRCPAEVEPHLEKIIQAALAYMSYDPNYSYGTTDDEELEGEEEDEDEYDVDDGDEYEDEEDEDDDDDESWKVRRSAIRALKAVVEAKKHDPSPLWTTSFTVRRGKSAIVAAALVGRFKEREENCRVGVIDCFTRFLQVTVAASSAGVVTFASEDEMDTSSGPAIELRSEYAPKLVKACEKIMCVKKGNDRSKSSALALLSCLCQAPGGVGGQQEIASVFKHVQTFLSAGTEVELHREGTSKALRLDALSLVHAMLVTDNHDPVHVRQSLRQTLFPELCLAVKEQWYKVIAEALRALASVPRFFVLGYTSEDTEETKTRERAEVGAGLYTAVEPLLAAHDVDQEIKECALKACAAVLSSLHANLTVEQKSRMLALLLDRLNNETTRIAAIKTLSSVASASGSNSMEDDRIDLSPILADSITTMASFLKLQSRSLKQHSLESLGIVVTNHGSCSELADGALYATVLQDFAPLIVDDDLHLSHLSL